MAVTGVDTTALRPMRVAAYADLALADLLERFARPDVDELLCRSIRTAATHDGDRFLLRASDPERLTDRSARVRLEWHASGSGGRVREGVATLGLLVVRSGNQPTTELLLTLAVPDEVAGEVSDTLHRFLEDLTRRLAIAG